MTNEASEGGQSAEQTPELLPNGEQRRKVEWFRECPHCWQRLGGVGTAQRTISPEKTEDLIGRRYYKCDTCGHNFDCEFIIATIVETREVVKVIRR